MIFIIVPNIWALGIKISFIKGLPCRSGSRQAKTQPNFIHAIPSTRDGAKSLLL